MFYEFGAGCRVPGIHCGSLCLCDLVAKKAERLRGGGAEINGEGGKSERIFKLQAPFNCVPLRSISRYKMDVQGPGFKFFWFCAYPNTVAP